MIRSELNKNCWEFHTYFDKSITRFNDNKAIESIFYVTKNAKTKSVMIKSIGRLNIISVMTYREFNKFAIDNKLVYAGEKY